MNNIVEDKKMYSEIYAVLEMLGDKYKKRVPKKIYDMIIEKKSNDYNIRYDKDIPLEEQDISKDAISFIAMLHYNFWYKGEDERCDLAKVFIDNEKVYQYKLDKKYNTNVFEKVNEERVIRAQRRKVEEEKLEAKEEKKNKYKKASKLNKDSKDLIVNEKESVFNKIITKIRKLFK